jgi:hypothetical protein
MITIDYAAKIVVANQVLATFSRSRIERRRGGFYVVWACKRGDVAKRWCTRGQDFYPMWHRQWPGGGTASTALSQLIRWLRGQAVLPAATWRYWATEKIKLLPHDGVVTLLAGGYPEHSLCVLCGRQLNGSLDWWHLDGTSGPCCAWTSGCRQTVAVEKLTDVAHP